jgi:hypothetical protein
VIVFLSRDFGGIHLGNERFTIINKVVQQALSRYNAAMQRNHSLLKPDRLQFNMGDQSTEADQVPAWQQIEKPGPETQSATNLAKESAYRMPTPHSGYQYSDDPVVEEMYNELMPKKQTGASNQRVVMDNQYNILNTTKKATSAGSSNCTIPTQDQYPNQDIPFTPTPRTPTKTAGCSRYHRLFS